MAIFRKFNVSRTDGRDAPGGDREDARYFVVDVTNDPAAPHVLHVYATHLRLNGTPEDRADAHTLEDLADAMLVEPKQQAEIARASTL